MDAAKLDISPMQQTVPDKEASRGSSSSDSGSAPSTLDVDDLLARYVGPFGLWQWTLALFTAISFPTMVTFSVFSNTEPLFRCRMPDSVEQVFSEVNATYHQVASFIGNHTFLDSGCWHFAAEWSDLTKVRKGLTLSPEAWRNSLGPDLHAAQPCQNGYEYEYAEGQFPSSVIADFDLVCSRGWIGPFGESIYFLGLTLGFTMSGWLGGIYGRRRTILGFCVGEMVSSAVISSAPNQWVYHIGRLMLGTFGSGTGCLFAVLIMETTLAKYRSILLAMHSIIVGFAQRALMAGVAYATKNWRWLNALGMSPVLLAVVLFWFLPESPRWLMSQNRPADALAVLRKAAKINRHCRTGSELEEFPPDERFKLALDGTSSNEPVPKQSSLLLLTDKKILKTLLLCIIINGGTMMTMFGVMLYGRVVRDSVYIVFLINNAMAVPGPIIAAVLYRIFRYRRVPLLGCFVLIAVTLTAGGLYALFVASPDDTVLNVCANLALAACAAGFSMLQIYTTELFASSLRSQALGVSNAVSRMGCTLVTMINELDGMLGHGSPLLVYAILASLNVAVLFFVENTSGEALPDVVVVSKALTVNDARV